MNPTADAIRRFRCDLARRGIQLDPSMLRPRYPLHAAFSVEATDRPVTFQPDLSFRPMGNDPSAASTAEGAEWPKASDEAARAGVAYLVRERTGWQPTAWRDHLLRLAESCEDLHPARSDELRLAAVLMTPAWLEAYRERAAIMEYDGNLPRPEAELLAAKSVLSRLGLLACERMGSQTPTTDDVSTKQS